MTIMDTSQLRILTTDPPGSPGYQAVMKGKLSGSAMADVLGCGRNTPLRRWAFITGKLEPEDISEKPWIEYGNDMEPVTANRWEKRTERKLAPSPGTIQHPTLDWLCGTPDRLIPEGPNNPPGIWEGKTTSAFFKHEWDEHVPTKHRIQLYTYLACTPWRWGSFGAYAGSEFLWKDEIVDPTFMDWMLNEANEFMEQYVFKDTAPPATGKEPDSRTLRQLHPDDNGASVRLSIEAVNAVMELETLKPQMKDLDLEIESRNNLIKQELGANTFGIGPDFVMAWKTTDRAGFTVSPTKTRVLRKQKSAK